MKRVFSLCLAVLMLLSTVLGLVSCGEMTDDGAIVNAYYVGEMYDFDPARAAIDDDAMRILALLYEPLFTLDKGGNVRNALAASYKILKDKELGEYKMEITLKPTTWSDGNTVTAYDVVYAWKRILEPDFKSQAAPLLYEIENAIEAKNAMEDEDQHPITTEDIGAVAVNATTISITFRKTYDENGNVVEPNYDAFLRNLTSVALAPVRQSVVSSAEDYWGKRALTIVTNGPFTVRTLDYDLGEFTLERNRYYEYANKDSLGDDRADAHVTPYQIITNWTLDFSWARNWDASAEPEKAADFIAEHSLFLMAELPLSLREAYKDKVETEDTLSTMSILFNTVDRAEWRETALGDPVIRKALSDVLDREEIAKILVFATPATGLIAPGVFNANNRRVDFRKEGGELLDVNAKEISTEATNAIRALSMSEKKLTLAYNDTEADRAVANYIKERWTSIGFSVTLKALKYNEESVLLDLGAGDSQELTYRGSQLIDVYQDFAIGDADSILDKYRNDNTSTLYHNDTELNKYVFDALLVDYQMLAVDAFAPLCGFTTTLNGNGIDLSNNADMYQNLVAYKHVTGFSNIDFDNLIEAALNERDLEARAEILHEAEELLLEEMPIVPLTFGQTYYLKDSKIRNIDTNYYGYPLLTKMQLKNYQQYLPGVEDAE